MRCLRTVEHSSTSGRDLRGVTAGLERHDIRDEIGTRAYGLVCPPAVRRDDEDGHPLLSNGRTGQRVLLAAQEMIGRHLGAAVVVASGLAALLPRFASAQADKFKAGCPLPFFGIQDHHSIDTVCQNAGEPGDDAQAENEKQNRAKNNFCAVGTPALVTKKTFEALQRRTDQLKADTAGTAQPFTYGSHKTPRRSRPDSRRCVLHDNGGRSDPRRHARSSRSLVSARRVLKSE